MITKRAPGDTKGPGPSLGGGPRASRSLLPTYDRRWEGEGTRPLPRSSAQEDAETEVGDGSTAADAGALRGSAVAVGGVSAEVDGVGRVDTPSGVVDGGIVLEPGQDQQVDRVLVAVEAVAGQRCRGRELVRFAVRWAVG